MTEKTKTKPPSPSATSESAFKNLAERVNQILAKNVESIVNAGQELKRAKDKLGHGRYLKFLKSGFLKTDKRSAQMMVRIAENSVISKAHNHALLPTALNTLYALTQLKEADLEQLLKARRITPSSTTNECKTVAREMQSANEVKPVNFKNIAAEIELQKLETAAVKIRKHVKQLSALVHECPAMVDLAINCLTDLSDLFKTEALELNYAQIEKITRETELDTPKSFPLVATAQEPIGTPQ